MNKLTMPLFLLSASLRIFADTFGTGTNQFAMEFVAITGGTNTDHPDASYLVSYGAVPHDYRMGKHEVSRAMIIAHNTLTGGPGISLQDMSSFGGNGSNRPALGISWNEAARFVNWLNVSSGYSPAYKFTTGGTNDNLALWTASEAGYDPSNAFRNTNAFYFLPSDDEWYRAAYYDPVAQVYRDYPTGTDVPNTPTPVASGTNWNTAVYGLAVTNGPADITQAGGLSPFGTMAQGGNVAEWMESAEFAPNDSPTEDRGVRASGWYLSESWLRPGRQGEPTTAEGFVGFRVASKTLPNPVLRLRNPRRPESAFVVEIESNVGPVDVYRSTNLANWGESPIATNVAPGTGVAIDPSPPTLRAFYLLTSPGALPPGG